MSIEPFTSKVYYSPNEFQSYGGPEINAVAEFLKTHAIDDHSVIEEFERRVAAVFGVTHGIFVNSGSSANLLCCLCAEFGAGDEVITPACTFSTTLSPLVVLGSKPVFCDIDEHHLVPSVQQVIDLVTSNTKGIIIPDLVGDKFDFSLLREALHNMERDDIIIIEDACDTITETTADFATLSMYASHIINSGGLGGMVLTNNDLYASKCRALINDGAWDFRAPSFCAAFGLKNMERLEQFRAARRQNYAHYMQRLKDCHFYELFEDTKAVWLSLPIIAKNHRYEIVQALEKSNVQTRMCLAGNILRQPYYSSLFADIDPNSFTNTNRVFENGFLIGLHQGITPEVIDKICDLLIYLAHKFKSTDSL